MSERQPRVDPAEVQRTIAYLDRLTDDQYKDALADNLLDEDLVETAAFRSPQLALRSYAAVNRLIQEVNTRIHQRAGESNRAWLARQTRFRTRAGEERTTLSNIRISLFAQQGITLAAPNPRGRATRDLHRMFPDLYVWLVRRQERLIREEGDAKRAAQGRAPKKKRVGRVVDDPTLNFLYPDKRMDAIVDETASLLGAYWGPDVEAAVRAAADKTTKPYREGVKHRAAATRAHRAIEESRRGA